MTENLSEIGLNALDKFINTFNSRDVDRWADSLNFPHVRPSAFGPVVAAATKQDYVDQMNYDRILATGWDHSAWDYKQVLHTSPAKIHVAGQWSRYNADGDKILTIPVVYIVTNKDGHWAIQSRFGADYSSEEEDTSELEARAFNLIKSFAISQANGRTDACAELLNYPHFEIGVGKLTEHASAESYPPSAYRIDLNSMIALQTGKHSINVTLEISVTAEQVTRDLNAVLNITDRDDHLGIQVWSVLDPNLSEQVPRNEQAK